MTSHGASGASRHSNLRDVMGDQYVIKVVLAYCVMLIMTVQLDTSTYFGVRLNIGNEIYQSGLGEPRGLKIISMSIDTPSNYK